MPRKVIVGTNDLATVRPDLAAQLVDESLGSQIGVGSGKKVEWQCDQGHRWFASPNARTGMVHRGCPYCSNKKVLVGFNDLNTTHPDVASLLVNKEDGLCVTAGSGKSLLWHGTCGHEWSNSVRLVVKGVGCPYCAGKRVLVGFNDLQTVRPDLAAELVDQSLAVKLVAGSNKKVQWRCSHGHVWSASVNSRVMNGTGCPYCSGRKVDVGINDLATLRPDMVAELVDKSLATELSIGSGQYVEWQCKHGHRWFARVAERCLDHATGCPVCNGGSPSAVETEFFEFIQSLVGGSVTVLRNDRTILSGKELEIVVSDKHIAFEFNGTYWHHDGHLERNSHVDKYKLACDNGYRLIFIWEDQWQYHKEAVKRLVAAQLGFLSQYLHDSGCKYLRVFARNLVFGEVSGHAAAEFMDKYHLQGIVAATRHFGLFDGDVLLAVMSVRKCASQGRLNRREGDWDIQRYATACQVVGGFSKLLSHAEQVLLSEGEVLKRWISFSANEVSDGNMYQQCGFVLDAELSADYKYVGALTSWRRVPKERFQLRRFREDKSLN